MMDPAKLKVVELRAHLTKRGLDAKGNKPVLVERLRKALEEENEDATKKEPAQVDSRNDNDAETTQQKDSKDESPPTTPTKPTGRTSRSSSATTPSKITPPKAAPKVRLSPLPEKQISPAKSPIVEKKESVSSKTPTREKAEVVKTVANEEPPEVVDPGETKDESSKKIPFTVDDKPSRKSIEPSSDESVQRQKATVENNIEEDKNEPAEIVKNVEEEKIDDTVEESIEDTRIVTQDNVDEIQDDSKVDEIQDVSKVDEIQDVSKVDEIQDDSKVDEIQDVSKVDEMQDDSKVDEIQDVSKVDEMQDDSKVDEIQDVSKVDEIQDDSKVDEIQDDSKVDEIQDDSKVDEIQDDSKVDEIQDDSTIDEIQDDSKVDEIQDDSKVDEIQDDSNVEQLSAVETTERIEEMETDSKDETNVEETDIKTLPEDVPMDTQENVSEASITNETIEEKPQVKEEVERMNASQQSRKKEQLPRKETKVETKEPKVEAEEKSEDRDKKDRRDRKRKRSSSPEDEKQSIATPLPSKPSDEPDLQEAEVVLSWYDSDLNLLINKSNFVSATAMHNDGFGYVWAGARASYGFTEGKVYYETKITQYCEVDLPDEESPHVMRAGWSIQGTSMQLGEEPLTYGFGGTGKISSGNKFSDYGERFGKDDVIGCYLDFLTNNAKITISYTINGKNMGTAFTIDKHQIAGKALYPHVLTKNCSFACNFGQEAPWSANIIDGYVPVGSVDLKNRVQGPRRPEKKEDCEMIMMCGLPAAGKTVWASNYARSHPDKMYNILGTNILIDKMKVIGLPRKRNYHGRWETLIQMCTKCLNKLLEVASTRRRNYILDQTNVYPTAQRRKMRNFFGYQRRAVVIVPTDEEWKARTVKRTAAEGEVIPEANVLEMKANFGAPVVGDLFDSVEWIELNAEEGKKLIEKYNKEGKEAGYTQQQMNKRPRFEKSDNHRENRSSSGADVSRQNSRDSRESRESRESRDHRDRRNNYPDRNRTPSWRGGSNSGSSGGWKDRQPRVTGGGGGHVRHGYGAPPSVGWRGRAIPPASSYRPTNDRRVPSSGHDRRTSGSDRNRAVPSRSAGWAQMSYQNSQQPSGGWGGGGSSSSIGTSGNWHGQSQSQSNWSGGHSGGWSAQQQHQSQHPQQQQQQQWGNWKGYGQNNYGHGQYSQQGYGNGNWGSWNQQYYNQYWGQQQPTGQTSAAGSQAGYASTTTGNSTTSTGSTYSSYSPGWHDYSQSYDYPVESSNTNAQQQK